MGWKGTMRSIRAEARRAEKRQIQYEKMQMVDRAREAVDLQEQYLDGIQSIHKKFSQTINWKGFIETPEPDSPTRKYFNEEEAKVKWESYSPSFFIKILKLGEWRKERLRIKIEKARSEDELVFEKLMAQYKSDYDKWNNEKKLAERVCSGDLTAYEEVMREQSIITGGSLKCSSYTLKFEGEVLIIEADVLTEDQVLPNKIYSLTKTGKVSEKNFSTTQYNQLYQDYVCSSALAVAKVFLNLFPLEKVVINSMSQVLNTATGTLERQTLLSVFIPKTTLTKINLQHVDPSDCMKNFVHNMSFKNNVGMSPVEQLMIKQGRAS